MKKLIKTLAVITAVISAFAALTAGISFIAERIEEFKNRGKELAHKPYGVYERFIKRPLDCFLSTGALIVFCPILLVLTVVGSLQMKGNPFFTQERPGRNEKIFRLIKFRTMTNERDPQTGELLPDEVRLNNKWGKFIRQASLDELPSLVNLVKGDMAVIGPRPLLVKYLPLYSEEQRHRHDVRPGLTGLAQANGRNALSWEEKFAYDTEYVNNITFKSDLSILLKTVITTFKREGINHDGQATMEEFKIYGESV